MSLKIIVCVTTDLVTDQRVNKVCTSLHNNGFDILLVGRQMKKSLPLTKRSYSMYRFKLFFEKGFLFYATYNIRLFIFLLFKKADIFLANDLDTLLAVYLAAKIKNVKIAYDNHEYFTGVPELIKRPFVKGVWKTIEKWIFPKLKYVYTDNDSKKKLFEDEYGVNVRVVKNVPVYNPLTSKINSEIKLPEDKKILIYQGSGINVDRGAEELTEAMKYLDDGFLLLFVGSGDVIDILKEKVKVNKLDSKVIFTGKVPFEVLQEYTRKAHLGFTLDKPISENYIYSLPNKLFDYVHSGIPVMASRLVEIERMINKYEIGTFVESHDPKHIAEKILFVFSNPELMTKWKLNLSKASKEVNWQNEEIVLLEIYNAIREEINSKK
jgi:glycosyltransferase involved in cell wall biosynthesis